MNEKDSIKDLFSNAFEQHTSTVRPEVWQGLQSKMAAAGITASGATAVKGISALTKWIIGGAAVAGTTIVTTLLISSNQEARPQTQAIAQNEATSLQTKESEGPATPVVPSKIDQKYQAPTESVIAQPAPVLSGIQQQQSSAFVYIPIAETQPTTVEKTATPPANAPFVEPVEVQAPKIPTDAGNESAAQSQKPLARLTRVPNAFTPNYDGDNDVFFVESENITDFSVMIIQAATQKVVYTSTNPEFKWDGTDQAGTSLPAGQYRCVIIGSGTDQKVVKSVETVTLVR